MDFSTGVSFPLAALRLLVPPLQLMAASMWQVVKKKEVTSFWKVAEFVSLVMDMVPELLQHKHSTQLILGLRARYILELCRKEPVIKHHDVSDYLDKIKSTDLEGEEEEGVVTFTELVHSLLHDSDKRRYFFLEVLPAEYGADYDNDLQTLFWEFLYQLTQLMPVPDLQKTVSWLGSECSLLNHCSYSVPEPADLATLLQHHKHLGHLQQHVLPSNMGDNILSSLSAVLPTSVMKSHISVPVQPVHEDIMPTVLFVDDVAVTDYTEVELRSTTRVKDTGNSCCERTSVDTAAEGSPRMSREGGEEGGEGEKETPGEIGSTGTDVNRNDSAFSVRPKRCTDCGHSTVNIQEQEVGGVTGSHDQQMMKGHSDQSPNTDPNPPPEISSSVRIRTSGRVRRPTMKIQGNNTLKCLANKRRKETSTTIKPGLHSCSSGLSDESSKDGDAGGLSGVPAPQCSLKEEEVQQHTAAETSSLQEHSGRFSCSQCEKSFKFQCLLVAHRRSHTGEQPFTCSQCSRRFSFKQSLDRHQLTHRTGRGTPRGSRGGPCAESGRALPRNWSLLGHRKSHAVEAEQEGEEPHRYPSKALQSDQEEKPHICNCGKSFAQRSALAAHQRIHRKERPHACAQCGKGFLYKGGLLSHMKIHSEEKPFICSFCGKSFKRERNMKTHEHGHTRENVFSCSLCDKSFVYKATLTRHQLTHSGERPYLCSDCGKGFFSHAELLKHERFHTGHKPFQCPHCGKQFTQSCYLTVHLRYHTGSRPYSCTQCDKSFLSANRLKRHQRIHSEEKPFLCVECGKRFRQSYNLKMHQRTHAMNRTERSQPENKMK